MPGPLYDAGRLAAALDDAGADALVVTQAPNVLYLTRYRKGGSALAVVTRERPTEPVLIIPAGDIDFVLEDLGDGVQVRPHGRFHRFPAEGVQLAARESTVLALTEASHQAGGRMAVLRDVLGEFGVRGTVVTDGLAEVFAELGGAPRISSAPGLLRQLRSIKTSEEVTRIARAAEVAEHAISRTNAAVRLGVTQDELAREFGVAVAEQGCRVRLDNVSVGRGTALGNVNQPEDVVEAGSVIRYDVGAVHAGYVSDLSRCYAVGAADERVARYYGALVEGQAAALEVLRPGVAAREVFAAAVAGVRAAGIPHYDRINAGHGIGLAGDGYDAPLLGPGDDTVIEAGMVLCVETPYYELGFAGLQVEDMVVVTDTGYESLTRLPRDLEIIG